MEQKLYFHDRPKTLPGCLSYPQKMQVSENLFVRILDFRHFSCEGSMSLARYRHPPKAVSFFRRRGDLPESVSSSPYIRLSWLSHTASPKLFAELDNFSSSCANEQRSPTSCSWAATGVPFERGASELFHDQNSCRLNPIGWLRKPSDAKKLEIGFTRLASALQRIFLYGLGIGR